MGQPRILVIDDSSLMRKAAMKMLCGEFDVVTAIDGLDGWKKLEDDHTIKVVFTDLSMPEMDGHELLKKIRTAQDTGINGIPVIVMTSAENNEAAQEQVLAMGATDFIAKPFRAPDLLARARAHVNYQRITRQYQEQATLDHLTGLLNKRGFVDRLRQDVAFAKRHQQPLTVVMLEVESFEDLFKQHGKALGDTLMVHVAGIIRNQIRKEDTAARYSLAAFMLSLPASLQMDSKQMADRIRMAISSAPLQWNGGSISLTVSAGVISPSPQAELSASSIVRACQRMLESALEAGGDRVVGDVEPYQLKSAHRTPAEKPGTSPGPGPGPGPGIDQLLAQVEQGERADILVQLPRAIDRLVPLLRLLNARQRQQLIRFLQKLG